MSVCPRPDKEAHATRAEAERHLRNFRKNRGMGYDLVTYRCPCGAWHVGNSQKNFTQRVRKALGKGPKRKPRHRHA